MKIVVAITGATGAVFGVRILGALAAAGVETHLVMTKWAERTVEHELGRSVSEIRTLATECHSASNQAASISSGSFVHDGMVIAPCSMRTLAAISCGFADNLVVRAADVTLKERRKLVVLVRETPLHEIHLENMLRLARLGAVIMPPVPAFYNHPETVDDLIGHIAGRVLDQFGVAATHVQRWEGELRGSWRSGHVSH